MGACTKVLGAVVAMGIALGTPALAWAQAPLAPLSESGLPWQPGQVFTRATPFGDGYQRVLRDTFEAFEAFADLSRYGAPPAITPAVQVSVPSQFWGADMRTFIPPSPEQPIIYVGPARAQLIPIETASTVVAESRGMQGVLVGFQLELPWMIP
ncbi:hypothetical protein [Polyangium jinanense]|uniref:Uncharacterized protein n=1 Tax=Polyangium jinanense TaxID=2829994 RepID=A0A9X4AP26_9BACT|nr:hypothetical protein [Polyangium jinanense]MDC3953286.1 hypothetical protein [Polyangium jinanense]MDC3979594.1 hypothetical protein [Polyangium jinanense]